MYLGRSAGSAQGNILIENFVSLQMPIFTLQRSEEYYGKPLEFIPERWVEGTPEEAALNKRVPGSWMAFGEGTRSCVGQRFALQEAKITLARLFQRWDFPRIMVHSCSFKQYCYVLSERALVSRSCATRIALSLHAVIKLKSCKWLKMHLHEIEQICPLMQVHVQAVAGAGG